MAHITLITPEQLEQARLAFIRSWEARSEEGSSQPGERTTAGMRAALEVLGIGVIDDRTNE
jgi:hypothetical protein